MEVKLEKVKIENQTEEINLCLSKNQIHAIVGNSGSGKTKLIETIIGIRSCSGEVLFNNQKNLDEKQKKKIGYFVQDYDFYFFKNIVEEELLFTMEKYSYKDKQKRIMESLYLVGLNKEFLKRKISSLSLSEKRKLELAIILIGNPKLIILDDPTLFLDESEKKKLISLIKMMKRKYGKTIIIATKDVSFALSIADTITVYRNKVIFFDKKQEALKQIDLFEKEDLSIPYTLLFSNAVQKEKNISMGCRMEINDLIKDIYRYVT